MFKNGGPKKHVEGSRKRGDIKKKKKQLGGSEKPDVKYFGKTAMLYAVPDLG